MQLSFWDFYSLFEKEYSTVLKEAAADTGLTMIELSVLLFFANNPTARTASDMIRIRKAVKSHISLAVKQLTEKGYLIQRTSGGRSVYLEITPEAAPLIAIGRQRQKEFLDRICQGFSAAELAALSSSFERITDNLRREKI